MSQRISSRQSCTIMSRISPEASGGPSVLALELICSPVANLLCLHLGCNQSLWGDTAPRAPPVWLFVVVTQVECHQASRGALMQLHLVYLHVHFPFLASSTGGIGTLLSLPVTSHGFIFKFISPFPSKHRRIFDSRDWLQQNLGLLQICPATVPPPCRF